MNKRILICFAFLAVVLITLVSCSKADSLPDYKRAAIQSRLQELVNTELNKYKSTVTNYPGGVCMNIITRDGSFFVTSGFTDNITRNFHFRAASNTKTLTATAVLLLYQQKKLDLNHKITDLIPGTNEAYVPETSAYDIPYKNSITILDLLRHRAGIFDVSNDVIPDTISANYPFKGRNYVDSVLSAQPNHTFTFDELVGVVAATKLKYFSPGTGYHYSNTGYSILGKIIERVSKKSYQSFLMDEIIKPSKMMNSSMPVSGEDQIIPEPRVPGYVFFENEKYDVTKSNISANVAEGSLITTPDDLARYLRDLISGHGVLSPHLVNSIMMNYISTGNLNSGGYGCGLTYTNKLGYGHTGAHEGYLSLMATDPETDFTIVIFTNAWDVNEGLSSIIKQLTELLENTAYKAKYIVNSSL